jgi:hypothetical protein
VKRALSLFLAAALLAACGSDDDGDDGDRDPVETTPGVDLGARFKSPGIPFTFDYPENLKVRVRRTARTELRPRRYLDEFGRDLESDVRTVDTREDRVGELDVGVLEVKNGDFASVSYFFAGAGRTWQVECIANPEREERTEAGCRAAVESVEFHR